mmetsp:Transcript_47338/g.122445  ORF Transcript_47338/g.122445 Transcript_47338/m.122445 type:complete len:196 (-) Transcript_47338:44-631(-)
MSMDSFQFVSEFKALEGLLETKDEEEQQQSTSTQPAFATPADIGGIPAPAVAEEEEKKEEDPKKAKSIWDEEEIKEPEVIVEEDPDDDRPTPEYDIMYKQSVRPEDVFLGIDGKTPSSFDSEKMVVKIKLPNTKGSDLQLDVTRVHLLLKTPKYRLSLPLPHSVFDKEGDAKWISDKYVLEVTLPIDRSEDYDRA